MKKRVLIFCCAIALSACADKGNYQNAVLEQMQNEQDVKDYKIDPEYISKCVVETSAKKMPGLFPFDPERLTAYRNYTTMLKLRESKDPKAAMAQLRNDFGSAKALTDAHNNYMESVVECIAAVSTEAEKEQK
jgi:hypothetical protein